MQLSRELAAALLGDVKAACLETVGKPQLITTETQLSAFLVRMLH